LKGNAFRILVEKPGGKRQLGRPICTWDNNIKINVRKIGWGGIDCTGYEPVDGS
jgi:hypothetical protein